MLSLPVPWFVHAQDATKEAPILHEAQERAGTLKYNSAVLEGFSGHTGVDLDVDAEGDGSVIDVDTLDDVIILE